MDVYKYTLMSQVSLRASGILIIVSARCQKYRGCLGGAMVLVNFQARGVLLILIIHVVGQGPAALTADAGGVIWKFLLSSIVSLFFLPLSGRRPDID